MRPDSRMLPLREPLTIGLLLVVVLCSSRAWAQPPHTATSVGSVGGMKVTLPIVPGTAPRELEGFGDSIKRLDSSGTVASFIDSIDKSDAAFSVVVGQGRILTLKERVADEDGKSVVAVGDPSVADFQPLPNPRFFRVLGLRPGITDFSFTNAKDETVSLEIHVTYDLPLLNARLRQLFPDAQLRLGQLREHLVVEGQARNNAQVSRIIETLTAFLQSMSVDTRNQGTSVGGDPFANELPNAGPQGPAVREADSGGNPADAPPALPSSVELGGQTSIQARRASPRIINLIRVPGVQQVLLKVKIAELNRTAVREIGADLLGIDPSSGNLIGTQIGGAAISAAGATGLGGILGTAGAELGTSNTAFGIFPSGDWQVIMRALRQNGFVRVLAEPNLVAMSGHRANFLAGGEFPVPIPQATGAGANSVTVDFREFGVRLDFLPFVVDEDRIRLSVTPEVSTIDFTLGTTLVAGGDPVPGLNTRRANTTVEMKPGQTLAMAGLLQVELGGQTGRIPGLGDLPYIGPFFSNTSHRRVEKELLVLVTPHLVQPLDSAEGLPLPGDEIEDPTDGEFYLRNQYQGRTGVRHRSTVNFWPQQPQNIIVQERQVMSGPIGFGQ